MAAKEAVAEQAAKAAAAKMAAEEAAAQKGSEHCPESACSQPPPGCCDELSEPSAPAANRHQAEFQDPIVFFLWLPLHCFPRTYPQLRQAPFRRHPIHLATPCYSSSPAYAAAAPPQGQSF